MATPSNSPARVSDEIDINRALALFDEKPNPGASAVSSLAETVLSAENLNSADKRLVLKVKAKLSNPEFQKRLLSPALMVRLWRVVSNFFTLNDENLKDQLDKTINKLSYVLDGYLPTDIVGEIAKRSDFNMGLAISTTSKSIIPARDRLLLEKLADSQDPLPFEKIKEILQQKPELKSEIKALSFKVFELDPNTYKELEFLKECPSLTSLAIKEIDPNGNEDDQKNINFARFPPQLTSLSLEMKGLVTIDGVIPSLQTLTLKSPGDDLNKTSYLRLYLSAMSTQPKLETLNFVNSWKDSTLEIHCAKVNVYSPKVDLGNFLCKGCKEINWTIGEPINTDAISKLKKDLETSLTSDLKITVNYQELNEQGISPETFTLSP